MKVIKMFIIYYEIRKIIILLRRLLRKSINFASHGDKTSFAATLANSIFAEESYGGQSGV